MSSNLTGVDDLMKLLQRVEKTPAKVMTGAVKKAANIAKAEAKALAPKGKTGNLRRAIGIFAEKRRVGKKVYQLAFNRNYSDIFARYKRGSYSNLYSSRKGHKSTRVNKFVGKRYYYPASQEYGFKLRNGGRKPGKFFMRKSSKENRFQLEQMIVDELANSLRSLVGG